MLDCWKLTPGLMEPPWACDTPNAEGLSQSHLKSMRACLPLSMNCRSKTPLARVYPFLTCSMHLCNVTSWLGNITLLCSRINPNKTRSNKMQFSFSNWSQFKVQKGGNYPSKTKITYPVTCTWGGDSKKSPGFALPFAPWLCRANIFDGATGNTIWHFQLQITSLLHVRFSLN